MKVHFNGNYLEKAKVSISPDDRGFLFGDGVYEVIRAYRGHLFKWAEHTDRLTFGLKELRIQGLQSPELLETARRLLEENGLENSEASIYIQVTRGAAPRRHEFPSPETSPTIYVEARPFSPPAQERRQGVAAMLVPDQRWSRCDIKSINLLPNVLAQQRAREEGAYEAIFSRDGLIQEGSHSSILFVEKGVLIAPPLTNRILPSVTRKVVLDLAGLESIKAEIRPCRESEIVRFDEVLMVGTASEIIPITIINGRSIGGGIVGPVCRRLQQALEKILTSQ